jgi:N-ethylmaleimide reductase
VLDGLAFGFHGLGEPLTLADIRAVYRGALMGNCGHTKESGEAAIATGNADLIAYGRPFITNPDLVERFRVKPVPAAPPPRCRRAAARWPAGAAVPEPR